MRWFIVSSEIPMTTLEVTTPVIRRHLNNKIEKVKLHFLKDELPELVRTVRDLGRAYLNEALVDKGDAVKADHTALLLNACSFIPMGKFVKWTCFKRNLETVVIRWATTI